MTDKQQIEVLKKRVGELVREKQDLKEENEALQEKLDAKAEHCAVCTPRHHCPRRCDR